MKGLKKTLLTLSFLWFVALAWGQVSANPVNSVAAQNCLAKASAAFGAEQYNEALVYAQLGIAYDSSVADFPYLIAMCYQRLDYAVADQIDFIEEACSANLVWKFYDSSNAQLLRASLYARTKRYSEALAIVNTLNFHSSDIDYIKLACYYGLNQRSAAQAHLDECLDKWAFDFRFPKLFLQNERYASKTANTRRLAEKIIARSYVWETTNPEVLVLLSPFETDVNETIRRLKVYREMYAPFTRAYTVEDLFVRSYALLLSLNYKIINEATAVDEFFNMTAIFLSPETQKQTRVKGFFGKHLEELCRLVQSQTMRAQIAQKIVTYDSCIFDDENDGFLNTVIMYESGRPLKALIDTNQDMRLDITVECNFGIPSQILLPNQDMLVSYDEYPLVKNIVMDKDVYVMRPQDLSFKPITLQPLMLGLFDLTSAYSNLYVITENRAQKDLSQAELLQAAVYIDITLEEEPKTIERVLLNRGVAISAQTILGDSVIARTQYTNGRASVKYLDRNCDGYFETEQAFDRAGNIIRVDIDINSNKRYEYTETHSTGLVQKYWDENEDGKWEILYTQSDNKISVQWVHPITKEIVYVNFVGAVPTTVSYLGVSESLYPNEKDTFYWVGSIPYPTTIAKNIEQEIERYFNQSMAEVVSYSVNTNGYAIFAVKSGGVIFAHIIE